MPQRHLVFARPTIGSDREDRSFGPPGPDALAALFPELQSIPAALTSWSGSRRQALKEAHAAALGVPFIVFGCGLLRAPPRRNGASPVLSATAVAVGGPRSRAANAFLSDRLLANHGWESPELLERGAATRRELVAQKVGGSWWHSAELPTTEGTALVVADRSASEVVCRAMLAAALAQNPAAKVVLLAAAASPPRGLLEVAAARGCAVVAAAVDPWAAIERAARIYVAGGETGFLALLAGREVHCFGNSFYSGWGVTIDCEAVPQRPFGRTLDEIFAGACLVATRCVDPYRNRATSFEEIVSILGDWRRTEAANRHIAVCVGMSFWKRRRVADFLLSAAGAPVFRRTARSAVAAARARPGSSIALWASRAPKGLAKAAWEHGIPLVRVEDGFLRSVGLGSDFTPSASLVLDNLGMHYDPRTRSDLERLLRETEFDPTLIERARRLIVRIVARGITKYNLHASRVAIDLPPNIRRILVAGQVEDDLSVRLGGGEIRGNLDLLGRVRAANPDACILYKPHPDIEAGHRRGAIPDCLAEKFADFVVRGFSTAALLAEIDELHTLTSLAGFEALLRRRRVVVYGKPFYAGWGLTTDLAPIDRGRQLSIEELVAGALILYPRYLDPVTRLSCAPEIMIERLCDPTLWQAGPLVMLRRLQGVLARRWSGLAARPPKLAAGRGWRSFGASM